LPIAAWASAAQDFFHVTPQRLAAPPRWAAIGSFAERGCTEHREQLPFRRSAGPSRHQSWNANANNNKNQNLRLLLKWALMTSVENKSILRVLAGEKAAFVTKHRFGQSPDQAARRLPDAMLWASSTSGEATCGAKHDRPRRRAFRRAENAQSLAACACSVNYTGLNSIP
jgi:hypothetical protein